MFEHLEPVIDSHPVTVAAVQMNSGFDVKANLAHAVRQLEQAARRDARVVLLPENFACMPRSRSDILTASERDGAGPIQDVLARAAERLELFVVAGSVPLKADEATEARVYTASLVYNEQGTRVARYDKLHLFDVDFDDGDRAERYRESDTYRAGAFMAPVVDTPAGRLGLSICYDLRFPELYRQQAANGAEWFTVPAAFTATTGAAHWRVLTRARAIENQSAVLAAGQCGQHANGRQTYGHSLLVDGWGCVQAELQTEPGLLLGQIDRAGTKRLRADFPALQHRRYPVPTLNLKDRR